MGPFSFLQLGGPATRPPALPYACLRSSPAATWAPWRRGHGPHLLGISVAQPRARPLCSSARCAALPLLPGLLGAALGPPLLSFQEASPRTRPLCHTPVFAALPLPHGPPWRGHGPAPSRHLRGPATCSPALLVRPPRSSPAAAWAPWRGHGPAPSQGGQPPCRFMGSSARPWARLLSVFRRLATGSAALLVCLPAQLLCCRPGPRVHLGQLVLQSLRHGRGLCSALLRGW